MKIPKKKVSPPVKETTPNPLSSEFTVKQDHITVKYSLKEFLKIYQEIKLDPFTKITGAQIVCVQRLGPYLDEMGVPYQITYSGNFRLLQTCECGGGIHVESEKQWKITCSGCGPSDLTLQQLVDCMRRRATK